MLEIIASLFQVAYDQIAHVRGIKILTWLRGSLVIFLYFWFGLCSSLFWELPDDGFVKNLQFCPENLGVMLEFKYIVLTTLLTIRSYQPLCL